MRSICNNLLRNLLCILAGNFLCSMGQCSYTSRQHCGQYGRAEFAWYVEPRGTVLRRFCGGHIKASWKRARCTFICSIASDAHFNSLLPAIIIGNNRQFDHQFAAATHGGKVRVWKHSTIGDTSWSKVNCDCDWPMFKVNWC